MYRSLKNINSVSNTTVPVYQLFKYNSLTHDQPPSASNYFTVTSGYPCQKCNSIHEGFRHTKKVNKSKPSPKPKRIIEKYGGDDLKDMDIVCYYSENCGYCKMTLEMLQEANVVDHISLKNLSDKKHVEEFRSKGGRGVPFFESRKTKKQMAGYPGSIDNLMAKLS